MAEKRDKLILELNDPRQVAVLFDGSPLTGETEYGTYWGLGVKDEKGGKVANEKTGKPQPPGDYTWFIPNEAVVNQLKTRLSIPADQDLTFKKGQRLTLTLTARKTASGKLAQNTEVIFGWNGEEKTPTPPTGEKKGTPSPTVEEPDSRPVPHRFTDLTLLMKTCYQEVLEIVHEVDDEKYPLTPEDIRTMADTLFIEANRQGLRGERAAREVLCREVQRFMRDPRWSKDAFARLEAIWSQIASEQIGLEEAKEKITKIGSASLELGKTREEKP